MNESRAMVCKDDRNRRAIARRKPLNGIDYLEVGDDQTKLTVFLLGKAPTWEIKPAHLRIDGGRRIRGIQVVGVEVERMDADDVDDRMIVTVDRPGDFSSYSLCIVAVDEGGRPTTQPPNDFDPRYACVCFSFKAGCPTDLDCAVEPPCDEAPLVEPTIDYLAKDYASFRRLILDRLALLMPDWHERHVPDLGITLVELLAYVGDQLSYFQDAVATEAYLDTCRQRISVRRHLRLIDYRLHEGCNARAWVTVKVEQPHLAIDPRDFYFVTAGGKVGPPVLKHEEPLPTGFSGASVFEPLLPRPGEAFHLYRDHNEILFYTWSESECCLPKGATTATLVDPGRAQEPPPDTPTLPCAADAPPVPCDADAPAGEAEADRPTDTNHALHLRVCDVLILEEVLSPTTGLKADADRSHRHAVRLTKVTRSSDPLTGQLLVEIEWCGEDALPFPLCISSTASDCRPLADVSVARGNVLLVDHGRTVADDLGQVPGQEAAVRCEDDCDAAEIRKLPGRYRPRLPQPDVTHALPPLDCEAAPADCGEACGPTAASAMLVQQPRDALAQMRLESYPAAPDGRPAFGPRDITDPSPLAQAIASSRDATDTPAGWLRSQLGSDDLKALGDWVRRGLVATLTPALHERVVGVLRSWVQEWEPRSHLLASGPDDRHFVVEVDDERNAWLRFGDGDCGRRPEVGESFYARYRVGNGSAGNVGADALTRIVFRNNLPGGVRLVPRNPIPAAGGAAPEPVDEARLRAPHALRARLERAITPEDYAAIVMRDFPVDVQRAAASFRFDGARSEVLVAVDARAGREGDPLLCRVERHLQRYRRIGHGLTVVAAHEVALRLGLTVCVKPQHLRGHVKAALLDALGNRALPRGQRGFFHPDNLTFGEGVALSRIVAAAQAVEGVESIVATQFERLGNGPNGEVEAGLLPLAPLEVARLDNDPSFPEQGQLILRLEGGR